MSSPSTRRFLCGSGLGKGHKTNLQNDTKKYLDYDRQKGANMRLSLPQFVEGLVHVDRRVLDLLEIASYVFCADRLSNRGIAESISNSGWARSFDFTVKVRDHTFWKLEGVRLSLAAALRFMTGDREFLFSFEPGRDTPPTSLFDMEGFCLEIPVSSRVMLFPEDLILLLARSRL